MNVRGDKGRTLAGLDPGILVFAGVYFTLCIAVGEYTDSWSGELVRDFHVGARSMYRGVMYGAEWLAWASDSCLAAAARLKDSHGRKVRGRRRNLRGIAARHRWRAREKVSRTRYMRAFKVHLHLTSMSFTCTHFYFSLWQVRAAHHCIVQQVCTVADEVAIRDLGIQALMRGHRGHTH